MKKDELKKCVSVQTKVSWRDAERLKRVAERGGYDSTYEILQYMVSVLLKYADPENEIEDVETKELQEFAKLFDGWDDSRRRIITTKPQGNRNLQLVDMICIYSEVGKKGYVGKKISFKATETKVTDNVGNVLEVILRKLYPEIYEKLHNMTEQIDERSISKTLEKLLDELLNDVDRETLERIFVSAKNDIEYGNVPKRKRRKGIEDVKGL